MEKYFIVGWSGGHPAFYQTTKGRFYWNFYGKLKTYKRKENAIKAAKRLSTSFFCSKMSVFKFADDKNRVIDASVIYKGLYNDNLIFETEDKREVICVKKLKETTSLLTSTIKKLQKIEQDGIEKMLKK